MKWRSSSSSFPSMASRRRTRSIFGGIALFAMVVIAVVVALGLGVFTSRAVQAPVLSIDMVTTGNNYIPSDDPGGTGIPNRMDLGTINNCLEAATGNSAAHLHTVHVVVQNVEDMVGWQVRINYLGERIRPNTVNFIPFADSGTGQNISFLNLPIDSASLVHLDLVSASSIPPALPGPQTAGFGASYVGAQTFPISPDTPHKTIPDDASYDAPTGGVLASFTAQVLAGNLGQASLFLNLDDGTPNGPGSGVAIFDGTSSVDVLLPVTSLGDAYHDEITGTGAGQTCTPLNCVTPECPPTPPPTPTPGPPDADNDGIPDASDNCPNNAEDRDGFEDVDGCPDPDNDQDGVLDGSDNCPNMANPDQANNDADASGDACDNDDDNDGVADTGDNCPFASNPGQQDLDVDGQGDACDSDVDGDGVANGNDACPSSALSAAVDSAGCSQGQVDGDGDGVCDPSKTSDRWCTGSDACLSTPPTQRPVDANGCSQAQVDGDLDGVCNPSRTSTLCSGSDNCPAIANPTQTDGDGDGLGDACDAVGRGTVPTNASSVTVQFAPINPATSTVLITPLSDPGNNILWVSLGNNQFTVNVRALGSNKHPPIQFMYQVMQ